MVTSPTLKRGIFTGVPVTMERKKPTNSDKDDDITMSWTTRIELGYPMPIHRSQNVEELL
jgi:hypothetical protein